MGVHQNFLVGTRKFSGGHQEISWHQQEVAPESEIQDLKNFGITFWVTRQILGNPDFPKNGQKTLFEGFSNAAKKPLKNSQKTLPRP